MIRRVLVAAAVFAVMGVSSASAAVIDIYKASITLTENYLSSCYYCEEGPTPSDGFLGYKIGETVQGKLSIDRSSDDNHKIILSSLGKDDLIGYLVPVGERRWFNNIGGLNSLYFDQSDPIRGGISYEGSRGGLFEYASFDLSLEQVPLPASSALLLAGVGAFAFNRKRRSITQQ